MRPLANLARVMLPGEVDLKRLVPRTARRGWTLRCPACGGGGLFRRYAKLRDACPRCGHVLRREQGSQTGSMYLTAAVNQVFAALVILVVFTTTDWGLATQLLVSVPIVAAFCVAFLPFSQTIWAGVEYVTDCINAEPWVARDGGGLLDARGRRGGAAEPDDAAGSAR